MDNLRDQCNLTWTAFQLIKNSVHLIQDPICSSYIETDSFINLYGELLTTLDGSDMSSYLDFFFEKSPINTSIYMFIDEDAKEDFRDLAEEMNLIPKFKEVCEGESAQEKAKRIQKISTSHKENNISPMEKNHKKINQMQKTLLELTKKIASSTDIEVIKRFQEKMRKIEEFLKKEVTL